MKVKVYDINGKKTKEEQLPQEVFGIEMDADFLSDIIVRRRGNARQGGAHTKTRAERRGGGIKPWKQKGTGRARVGSSRTPIWRKGGVVFGPRKIDNWNTSTNAKEMKRAFAMALSEKARQENGLIILESMTIEPKTKALVALLSKLPVGKRVMMILSKKDENLLRASRNLPNVRVTTTSGLNLDEMVNANSIIVSPDVLISMQKDKK